GVGGRGEVAAFHAPVADALGDAGDQGADTGLALLGSKLAMKVLRRDDVGGGHRPVSRDLDIFLLKDGPALEVLNDGIAELPDDLVERGHSGAGKVAREGKSRGALAGSGGLVRGFGAGGLVGNRRHGEVTPSRLKFDARSGRSPGGA